MIISWGAYSLGDLWRWSLWTHQWLTTLTVHLLDILHSSCNRWSFFRYMPTAYMYVRFLHYQCQINIVWVSARAIFIFYWTFLNYFFRLFTSKLAYSCLQINCPHKIFCILFTHTIYFFTETSRFRNHGYFPITTTYVTPFIGCISSLVHHGRMVEARCHCYFHY